MSQSIADQQVADLSIKLDEFAATGTSQCSVHLDAIPVQWSV